MKENDKLATYDSCSKDIKFGNFVKNKKGYFCFNLGFI